MKYCRYVLGAFVLLICLLFRFESARGDEMSMELSSTAFVHNGAIPRRHTADGEDLSPPLQWSNLPSGTRELALIVDDPDAPTSEPWVHWVIFKIAPEVLSLGEGRALSKILTDPNGALQGRNSWNTVGYRGPAPPRGHGVHHYHFALYALSKPLELEAGATKKELLAAMKDLILAKDELVGTYRR